MNVLHEPCAKLCKTASDKDAQLPCLYGEPVRVRTGDLLIKSQRRVTAFLRNINRLAGAALHGFARSGGSGLNCGVV